MESKIKAIALSMFVPKNDTTKRIPMMEFTGLYQSSGNGKYRPLSLSIDKVREIFAQSQEITKILKMSDNELIEQVRLSDIAKATAELERATGTSYTPVTAPVESKSEVVNAPVVSAPVLFTGYATIQAFLMQEYHVSKEHADIYATQDAPKQAYADYLKRVTVPAFETLKKETVPAFESLKTSDAPKTSSYKTVGEYQQAKKATVKKESTGKGRGVPIKVSYIVHAKVQKDVNGTPVLTSVKKKEISATSYNDAKKQMLGDEIIHPTQFANENEDKAFWVPAETKSSDNHDLTQKAKQGFISITRLDA